MGFLKELFDERFTGIILYGVALGMGVSTVVLTIMGFTGLELLIGIGIFCLGLAGLNSVEKDDKPKKNKK
jgi:hypothetical protein